jgi:leucyl aminopeptidase
MATVKISEKQSAPSLVIGVSNKDGKLTIESSLAGLNTEAILGILDDLGTTAKADAVTKFPYSGPKLIYVVGLGDHQKNFDHEVLRRAAGSATRALAGQVSADFALPHRSSAELAAIAEGITLGAYSFTEFRASTKSEQKPPLKGANIISSLGQAAPIKAVLKRAEIIGKATALTRDLINTPPSHLTPASFSDRLKKLAVAAGLKVEILNESQLRAKGYGGISSVGQGSANPPRLLHVSYNPPKAKKRYALVGKGITFDSGGYALKPAAGMEEMKTDMSGAAAVIATAIAIAELKIPVAIEAYACLAENMISDHATRPSDVITIYGGKTVEVLNPDAEGRLVLADGLIRASEDGKKLGRLDGIIDVATLTGAQLVALGTRTSAVMTNDGLLQEEFLTAADLAGEAFWPMPLPEELRASLDSPIADIANIGDRMGGMLVAGLFLKEFVAADQPWVHLDIAGPANNTHEAYGYTPVGGTGIAVRSLITLAELAASQA